MMSKFDNVRRCDIDSLPESIRQEINERCAEILVATLNDGKRDVAANIALGGLQKACAVLLGNFFHEKDIEMAKNALFEGITYNIEVFKNPQLQKRFFGEEP